MLGTSGLVGSSGDGGGGGGGGGGVAVSDAASMMAGIGDEEKGGRGGGGGGEFYEGDRSTGGNRWPRQETIALLKIRSDMDVVFRDSSLKGPLWEDVSRKMAELGYHRSAKKCKEKFENVYKYHKRTKEGRVGKSDGKTYRFFDQLEALEREHQQTMAAAAAAASVHPPSAPPRSQAVQAAVPVTMVMPAGASPAVHVTVPSSPHPISIVHAPPITPSPQQHQQQQQQQHHQINVNPISQILPVSNQPHQQPAMPVVSSGGGIQMENSGPSTPSSATQSTSSSTSSDEELLGRGRKRKRKWKGFFERLMREVIDKQEELQKRFLEAVEKREHDRMAREEAWKVQELARLNREHEILVQERSMAAAKDAALVSFLQKLSEQQQIPLQLPVQVQQAQAQVQVPANAQPVRVAAPTNTPHSQPQSQPQPQPQQEANNNSNPVSLPTPVSASVSVPPVPVQPLPQPQPLSQLPPAPPPPQQTLVVSNVDLHQKASNGDNNNNSIMMSPSSSRWPKAEVQALINLRTSLDQKYQENGPKGPLWEEISAAMRKLGYNRNAKRCKEKWENINKYFKKVKESNKKRPEDSKTCPYFHQLDALYREKNKSEPNSNNNSMSSYQQTPANANPNAAPNYGQLKPEGIGPATVHPEQQWPGPMAHHDDQGSDHEDTEDDEGDEEDDDDQGNGYEIVANNASGGGGSMSTTTTATTTAE